MGSSPPTKSSSRSEQQPQKQRLLRYLCHSGTSFWRRRFAGARATWPFAFQGRGASVFLSAGGSPRYETSALRATLAALLSSVRARLKRAAFNAGVRAIEKFETSPGGLPAIFGMCSFLSLCISRITTRLLPSGPDRQCAYFQGFCGFVGEKLTERGFPVRGDAAVLSASRPRSLVFRAEAH
jgi:hypothetical protein